MPKKYIAKTNYVNVNYMFNVHKYLTVETHYYLERVRRIYLFAKTQ